MAGDGRDATSDEEQQRRDSQSDEQQQRELAEILRVARIGSDWDVEDDSYVERAACTCTPQDQSKMAAWLPTLDEQVSFCVGDRAGGGVTNVSTFLASLPSRTSLLLAPFFFRRSSWNFQTRHKSWFLSAAALHRIIATSHQRTLFTTNRRH